MSDLTSQSRFFITTVPFWSLRRSLVHSKLPLYILLETPFPPPGPARQSRGVWTVLPSPPLRSLPEGWGREESEGTGSGIPSPNSHLKAAILFLLVLTTSPACSFKLSPDSW